MPRRSPTLKLTEATQRDYLIRLRNLLSQSEGEVKKIYEGKDTPAFEKIYAKNILDATNGKPLGKLADVLFNDELFKVLDKEAGIRLKEDTELKIYQLRSTLYKEQQEVYDNNADSTIMIICSRRAGKTELNARLVLKCLLGGYPVLYLNKTVSNSINQMFDLVLGLAKSKGLEIESKSKNEGEIKLTNGGILRFAGMNDLASLDKLRGFKFKLVIIDEVGHIKNGNYLIDEVVTPMTSDYKGSQVVMTGTPPRVKNFATQLWHNKRIRHYHWTAEVNPFIPDFREFIDKVCKDKGFVDKDGNPDYTIPFIQREYFGNMDAYDTEALVFKGWKSYYGIQDLLDGKPEVLVKTGESIVFHPTGAFIGIDWGGTDYNAIVCVLVDAIGKHAFVYDVWSDKRVGFEVIKGVIEKKYIDAIERLAAYGIDDPEKRVRIVTDTNEVEFCVDLANAGLPVEKAIKSDMMTSMENLAADLRTKRILIPCQWTEENNKLVEDLNKTVYERDEETDALLPEVDDTVYHPDAAHALRYAARAFTNDGAWLHTSAFNSTATDPTVAPGLENLKDYGPKGAKLMENSNGIVEEEFIL